MTKRQAVERSVKRWENKILGNLEEPCQLCQKYGRCALCPIVETEGSYDRTIQDYGCDKICWAYYTAVEGRRWDDYDLGVPEALAIMIYLWQL